MSVWLEWRDGQTSAPCVQACLRVSVLVRACLHVHVRKRRCVSRRTAPNFEAMCSGVCPSESASDVGTPASRAA